MDQLQRWVEQRVYVDVLLEWVVLAVLIVVLLVALSAIVYWVWWLRRLLRDENAATFINSPIPGVIKVKAGGGEIELSGIREGLPEFDEGTQEALRVLNAKVEVLQKSLARAEDQIANWDNVSGHLPGSGGRDART